MKNALISLSNIVCDALKMGMSVDLAELGNLRVSVPSKVMDTAAEVTAKDALKTLKIVFTPKQKMRDAANKVELSIDKGTVTTSSSGGTSGGDGEGFPSSLGIMGSVVCLKKKKPCELTDCVLRIFGLKCLLLRPNWRNMLT